LIKLGVFHVKLRDWFQFTLNSLVQIRIILDAGTFWQKVACFLDLFFVS
jgi:hypothetical protein